MRTTRTPRPTSTNGPIRGTEGSSPRRKAGAFPFLQSYNVSP
jgi:hypothetical protein